MSVSINADSMGFARQLLRWASMGIVPSQANAELAKQVVKQWQQSDFGQAADVRAASQVLGFCAMGVAPSAQASQQAIAELDRAMQVMGENSKESLKQRFLSQQG